MMLVVLAMWLVLSAVTTVVCAAVLRGGVCEERMRVRVPELF